MARPKTPLIDKQEVLEKALELIDRHGIEGLSMRALAGALGVNPASLYHHFADKGAILDGAARLALIERPRVRLDESASPVEQLVALSVGAYRTLTRHPNLVPLLVRRGERHFAVGSIDRSTRLLLAAGIPEARVRTVLDTLEGLLIGMATIDSHAGDAVPFDFSSERLQSLRSVLETDALDPVVRYEMALRALLWGWISTVGELADGADARRH